MLCARIQGTDAGAGTPPPGRLSPLGAGGINQMQVCGGLAPAQSCIPLSLYKCGSLAAQAICAVGRP